MATVAGVFKGGDSFVPVKEDKVDSSKQAIMDDNVAAQDEDDHDADAFPMVDSPPSSQGN